MTPGIIREFSWSMIIVPDGTSPQAVIAVMSPDESQTAADRTPSGVTTRRERRTRSSLISCGPESAGVAPEAAQQPLRHASSVVGSRTHIVDRRDLVAQNAHRLIDRRARRQRALRRVRAHDGRRDAAQRESWSRSAYTGDDDLRDRLSRTSADFPEPLPAVDRRNLHSHDQLIRSHYRRAISRE